MLRYSLEAPLWGISNEYPQHIFLWKNKKKYLPDTHSYLNLWILISAHIIPAIVCILQSACPDNKCKSAVWLVYRKIKTTLRFANT